MRPVLEGLSTGSEPAWRFSECVTNYRNKKWTFHLAMFSEARQLIVRFFSFIFSEELSHV